MFIPLDKCPDLPVRLQYQLAPEMFIPLDKCPHLPVCLQYPLAEGLEKVEYYPGILANALQDGGAGKGHETATAYCHGGGRTGMAVDKGHFPEKIAVVKECKHCAIIVPGTAYLDRTGLNDVHGVTGIALMENYFAFFIRDAEEIFALCHGINVRSKNIFIIIKYVNYK
jgi:hypothetical protein